MGLLAASGPSIPQPTEWHGIGNQINTTVIFARSNLVNVRSRCHPGQGFNHKMRELRDREGAARA